MPQFPSRAWMESFCVRFGEQPDAQETARVLDGVYRFVVTPSGPLTAEHRYDAAISPAGPPLARVVDDTPAPRVTITADYERWRQLITGQLDVAMAVMLRRIRISGDMSSLMSNLSSARPLKDALAAVDTQWLGEEASQ